MCNIIFTGTFLAHSWCFQLAVGISAGGADPHASLGLIPAFEFVENFMNLRKLSRGNRDCQFRISIDPSKMCSWHKAREAGRPYRLTAISKLILSLIFPRLSLHLGSPWTLVYVQVGRLSEIVPGRHRRCLNFERTCKARPISLAKRVERRR